MNLSDDKSADFQDRCYAAGIKDPVSFLLAKMPQVYDYLIGAFPRGILPTDIDGEVEVNGYFLRLEFKHEGALRNGRVPKGQLRDLSQLLNTKRFTVFIVGKNSMGDVTCMEVFSNTGKTALIEADKSKLREYCTLWSKKAEANAL